MTENRGRQLLPGQTSRVHVWDVEAGTARLVFASSSVLVEAPNVLDETTLVLNAGGDLWLLPLPADGSVLDETALVPVPMDGAPEINNDHVVDPTGTSVVVSGRDGDLYRVPLPGGGAAVRITDTGAAAGTAPGTDSTAAAGTDAGGASVTTKYYLHGIAADGSSLAATVGSRSADGVWTTDVALVDPATGEATVLTRDEHLDDGPSFAGDIVLFSTERFTPGTAQLASLWPGATDPVRITLDDRVNWFPHVSPDGAHLLYLSYEPGTAGHPADQRVELRMLPGAVARGARMMPVPEVLVALDGGQGTVNVPPWAPSSAWFAYCDYPM